MKRSQSAVRDLYEQTRFGSSFVLAGLISLGQACSAGAPATVDVKKSGSGSNEMINRSDDGNSAEKPYGSGSGTSGSSSGNSGSGTMPATGGESEAATIPGAVTGDTLDNKEPEAGQVLRNGVYVIKSQYSKKCIRVPESKREEYVSLVQYDCEDSADFKWRVRYVDHKYYSFTNLGNGKSIQIANQIAANEAFIEQASYVAQNYQNWDLVKNDDGTFLIRPRENAGLCLDVAFGSLSNSTQLQLWRECSGIGQKWSINPVY